MRERISLPVLLVLYVTSVASHANAQGDARQANAEDQASQASTATGSDAAQQPMAASVKPWSVAALLGYSVDVGDHYNWWGFGLGLRGGYNLGRIYLGGRLSYHFGDSNRLQAMGFTYLDESWHHWELGAEAGYEFSLADALIIRPEAGLGLVTLTSHRSDENGTVSDTNSYGYFSLGATLTYDVIPEFFIGTDWHLQIVFGEAATAALNFMLQAGMRL